MPAPLTLTPAVIAVLRSSEITADSLKLPGQLRREDYQAVNKIITAQGGKWNRSAGCHKFERDPRELFAAALETGKAKDIKKERQAFYTPAPIVSRMVAAVAGTKPVSYILEPSAGDGRLVRAMLQAFPGATGLICEIDDIERAKASEWGGVIGTDFMEVRPKEEIDLIAMNPPFTKGQDEDHIMHAWKFLRPGGTLVALCLPNAGERNTKRSAAMRELLDAHLVSKEILPEGSFQESGTGIAVAMIVLRKPAA